jgi:integrase
MTSLSSRRGTQPCAASGTISLTKSSSLPLDVPLAGKGSIVGRIAASVKQPGDEETQGRRGSETVGTKIRRGRPSRSKKRRQSHGSAWHWKQTDSWYYTLSGTKRRIPLIDEDGVRIRGKENKEAARLALARVKLAGEWQPEAVQPASADDWLVAKVCSEYIQYCERGVASGTISKGYRENTIWLLNDLCKFCGALPVAQLKKGHIRTWIESHPTWLSPATHRNAIADVLAAFNYVQENHDIINPLKGLKKPVGQPRLQSFSKEDEEALYKATDEPFRNFLFAAIHSGLRPYCELARMTAVDIEENSRGMMWRIYSSKTKKTRKIPVRPEVAELTRKLIAADPRNSKIPIFRNPRGKIWRKEAGVVRFVRLRKKLEWNNDPVRKKYSSYTCRHTFAHRMLSGYWNGGAGCSIETLAELIGDTPKVAFDHYGKEWGQHYQDPLWAAIGIPKARNNLRIAIRNRHTSGKSGSKKGTRRRAKAR